MRLLHRVTHGLRALVGRRRVEEDLDEELRAFLRASIDAKIAAGIPRAAAEREARLELGSPSAVKDWVRDVGWESRVESLWYDLRFAARILLRSRSFAVVAILTLALGTGANAAMFELLNAVRFSPLPVRDPHQLVSVGIDMHGKGRVGMGFRRGIHTEPIWHAFRAQQQAFASVLAWGSDRWDLATGGESVLAQGLYVSGSYFDALGLRAHAGRLFAEADDQAGCGAPGAVLSHALWKARYGGDASVVGRTITLNRRAFEVVGVAPEGFFGVEVGRSFDVAIPLCAQRLLRGQRPGNQAVWWLDVMGRLAPGWTVQRAQAHLATISRGIFESTVPGGYTPEWTQNYVAYTLTAMPASNGVSTLRTDYSTHLWLLFGATALILLITCANLTNLMIARATARHREIAVRLAIGASRGRVVRQMVAESVLIAAAAVAAGLMLANWLSATVVALLSTEGNTIVLDLGTDWRMFAFLAGVVALVCTLVGVVPALRATGSDPADALQSGGRASTDTHEALGFRRLLVVGQVALSVVLVVAALLFTRSLRNLTSVDLGFNPDVLAVYVDLSRSGIPPAARPQTLAQVRDAIKSVPGVRDTSEVFIVPLSGPEWTTKISVGGAVQEGNVYFNAVGTDYFRTLEMPVVAGRGFDGRDRPGAPRTAIVSETFVKRFLGGGDAIGRTFHFDAPGAAQQPPFEIVGVVGDTKYDNVREETLPIVYLAMAQEPVMARLAFVLNSDLPPSGITAGVTRAVTSVVPGATVSYDPVSQYVRELLRTDNLMTRLAALLGLLALVISLVGLYGVMSYTVARRTAEIGIRMALGAGPRTIVRMMLAESGVLLGIGAIIGVLLAAVASRFASQLLFGVTPSDPASFALAIGALAAVGLLASWLPARRASLVAPTTALRQ